jgi:tRNA threonylcarbamoyl adenosine modification protein (Sua5/YciO/YrdC/YwlC family)
VARMQWLDLKRPSPSLAKQVADLLGDGGVVAFPTDTVYGLGCSGRSRRGLQRLRLVKGSTRQAPYILLIGGAAWAMSLARRVTPLAEDLMRRYWPGPLSIVFDAADDVSDEITCGRGTVALRFPACAWCVSLCRELGEPVASTSANLAGETPVADAREISRILGDRLDLIVDGGRLRESQPSTIVDARGRRPIVLRQGALSIGRDVTAQGNEGGESHGGG